MVVDMGAGVYCWFPPVGASQLDALWMSQQAAGMDGLERTLGGDWIGPGDFRDSKAAVKQYTKLWRRLFIPDRYTAHICCDDDSYLRRPDGELVLHAGCADEFRHGEDIDGVRKSYAKWRAKFYKGRPKLKRGPDYRCRYDKRKGKWEWL